MVKKIGDNVEEGDMLAEIETDKATMEFESFYEGTLITIGVQEGETAPVDSLLTIIGPAGTDVSALGCSNAGSLPSASSAKAKKETANKAVRKLKKQTCFNRQIID